MIRMPSRAIMAWIGIALLTILTASVGLFIFRGARLPYHDSFAKNQASEWTPIGGTWQVVDGAVVNRTDENGAKLVTGSNRWKDYQLDADVKLIGHAGDVGVMTRVGDEERGADSYNGYYIGLRSPDSALVIGRADHGWMEGRPAVMPGGVQIGVWYHLRVALVGCDIGAQATNLATGQTTYAAFEEKLCVENGKIGLRSMSTGGAWRNISVRDATNKDFSAIRVRSGFLETPVYPIREGDYNHMREEYFRSTYLPARSYLSDGDSNNAPRSSSSISIAVARSPASPGGDVRLRGVVTLTSPLYIQDNSGGIAVQLATPAALNLGDEIELVGVIQDRGVSPYFLATSVALRADRTLVVPVSVTSTQAAGGAFDARLIELRGVLKAKHANGNRITLLMEDPEQAFQAIDAGDLSLQNYRSLTPGSELRIRGICTVGPANERGAGAFTILLRSMEDVEVLSGPPWWSPRILPRYVLLLLSLIALGFYTYLRIERWKMHAILDEREQLAYNMHDTLAQSFAGLGFHLQGVRNGLRTGNLEFQSALEKLDVACDLVTHTHREASAEIAALHPDFTESADVLTALERSTQSLVEADSPRIELVRAGHKRSLSLPARDALFQIGREAISNILRHSSAQTIILRLIYEPRQVVFEICDDGCGFSYSEHAEDFGIRGMRHRAQKAHGTLFVDTLPGTGTRISAHVPYGSRLGVLNWVQHQWSSTLRRNR